MAGTVGSPAAVGQHSLARLAIVLSVVALVRGSLRIVVGHGALAIRATRRDIKLHLRARRKVLCVELRCHAADLRTDTAGEPARRHAARDRRAAPGGDRRRRRYARRAQAAAGLGDRSPGDLELPRTERRARDAGNSRTRAHRARRRNHRCRNAGRFGPGKRSRRRGAACRRPDRRSSRPQRRHQRRALVGFFAAALCVRGISAARRRGAASALCAPHCNRMPPRSGTNRRSEFAPRWPTSRRWPPTRRCSSSANTPSFTNSIIGERRKASRRSSPIRLAARWRSRSPHIAARPRRATRTKT